MNKKSTKSKSEESQSIPLERARVKIIGSAAIIETEKGAKALAPVTQLCEIARRLGLILENYDCGK